ncbi:unnamed protein product, partial [Meganyctiphanes norvegica]|uniref:Caspase-3 n=1 Tax=Meganyctiphanes norvegica TaxID=48144 RepID=A0AAV2PK19_MEGNR
MDSNSSMETIEYETYPMCNSPHGISAVIYMEEKDSAYGKADYLLLERLWTKLNCDVREFSNPSRQQLDINLTNLRDEINCNPDKHDFFCLTFIGHGGCKEYIHKDMPMQCEYLILENDTICTVKDMRDMFTTSNCPGLAGKPKLLFIQACRGQKREIPAEIYEGASMNNITISQWSDHYCLRSSFTDTVSWYSLESGQSMFIQALCEVFSNHFVNKDFESMVKIVQNKISSKIYNGYAQTVDGGPPLRKTLYFGQINSASLPRFVKTHPDPNSQNNGEYGTADDAVKEQNSSYYDLGKDINQIVCECGVVSRKFTTCNNGKNSGKRYYACNENCGQYFIVWEDKLETYFKARKKMTKCYCSHLAVRKLRKFGSYGARAFYGCGYEECKFWDSEEVIANS